MNRSEHLRRLADESFDVLVIGGGATGCGCALDAATRGLRVALVERGDFGGGTSSRSTKLVHGGVRYLEQAIKNMDRTQFRLVREALRERKALMELAPHLVRELAIFVPLYQRKPSSLLPHRSHPVRPSGRRVRPAPVGVHPARGGDRAGPASARAVRRPSAAAADLGGRRLLRRAVRRRPHESGAGADRGRRTGRRWGTTWRSSACARAARAGSRASRVRDRLTGADWEIRARVVINAGGTVRGCRLG